MARRRVIGVTVSASVSASASGVGVIRDAILLPTGTRVGSMQWKLFADLAEVAGDREIRVDVGPGATVGEALDELFEARPALRDRVLDDSGAVADHINVLRNGENVGAADGLDTTLGEGDELALFPPVSGG
jgi:molybdopterin synthase sulfur carrier subunit